jgi:hypothetical protein
MTLNGLHGLLTVAEAGGRVRESVDFCGVCGGGGGGGSTGPGGPLGCAN